MSVCLAIAWGFRLYTHFLIKRTWFC